MKPDVIIYCDGSALDGAGGAAAILVSPSTGKRREVSVAVATKATNQRMEILAAITGLRSLAREGLRVQVVSDSKYVVDCFREDWIGNWRRKGWQHKGGERPNRALWETLDALVVLHEVEFIWVKGHNGHEENERADRLAVLARRYAHHAELQRGVRARAREASQGSVRKGRVTTAASRGMRRAQRGRDGSV